LKGAESRGSRWMLRKSSNCKIGCALQGTFSPNIPGKVQYEVTGGMPSGLNLPFAFGSCTRRASKDTFWLTSSRSRGRICPRCRNINPVDVASQTCSSNFTPCGWPTFARRTVGLIHVPALAYRHLSLRKIFRTMGPPWRPRGALSSDRCALRSAIISSRSRRLSEHATYYRTHSNVVIATEPQIEFRYLARTVCRAG
jgi:hypothetical protein